jgi:hypothetical protein
MISQIANTVFNKAINEYHIQDDIDAAIVSPFEKETIEHLLYVKNWIDTAQWHMEDVVRNPSIDALEGLGWKRRIDAQNQVRTDMVEFIDSYFLNKYKDVKPKKEARINTESIAWALDRLSILALKIFHMREESERSSATEMHRVGCRNKLKILLEQKEDLSLSIDDLILDIVNGKKKMKVYKQMKMYNDPSLNPILYGKVN